MIAVRRRHDHDERVDARDLGRHGVHQHRGGIGGRAARHIEADRLDGAPAPAELDADLVGEAQVLRPLALVEGDDARRARDRARRAAPSGRLRSAASISAFGDGDAGLGEVDAVEALRIVDQRRVAAGDHVLDDAADGVVDVLGGLAFRRQQRREALLEIRSRRIQSPSHVLLQPVFPVVMTFPPGLRQAHVTDRPSPPSAARGPEGGPRRIRHREKSLLRPRKPASPRRLAARRRARM